MCVDGCTTREKGRQSSVAWLHAFEDKTESDKVQLHGCMNMKRYLQNLCGWLQHFKR